MKTFLKNSKIYPLLLPTYQKVKQVFTAPKILSNTLFPKTLALLYHRVNALKCDPYELCVSPKNFEDHILFLKKNFTFLSLKDVYNNIKNKMTFRNGILLTFDDGYLDNFTNAFPILKKYNVPAVIFAAGTKDDEGEFWWDEIAQIFSKKENLPEKFSLCVNDVEFDFHSDTQETLEKTRNHIHSLLKPLHRTYREEALFELYEISSLKRDARKDFARCKKPELKSLVASGLISIGGHTAYHSQLSSLTPEEQEKEISENYQFLIEDIGLKNHVTAFAYPYGTKNDYSRETLEIVKKYYALAFSNFRGVIDAKTHIYEIPRFVVKNWNADEFQKKIKHFKYI